MKYNICGAHLWTRRVCIIPKVSRNYCPYNIFQFLRVNIRRLFTTEATAANFTTKLQNKDEEERQYI